MAFKEKSPPLKGLAADYVTWQRRLEALEATRPAVHGRVLELQQASMEGEGDPQALQTAKAELMDLDQKLEAAAARLKSLRESMELAAGIDLDSQIMEIPAMLVALEAEREKAVAEIVSLLARASYLLDNFVEPGNREILVSFLPPSRNLGAGSPEFAARRPDLQADFRAAVENSRGSESAFFVRHSEVLNLKVVAQNRPLRENKIQVVVNRAILAAS